MKSFLVVAVCTLFSFVYGNVYTTKYDNINIDTIIKSDRLLKNYVNCLLERSRCNKEGEELKRILPDAIHTNCSKCSETQKNGARKIIRHLIENRRDWWNELEAKYDSEGDYRRQYQQEIEKEGLSISV